MGKRNIGSFFGVLLLPLTYIVALVLLQVIGGVVLGLAVLLSSPERGAQALDNISYDALMILTTLCMFYALLLAYLPARFIYGVRLFEEKRVKIGLLFVAAAMGVAMVYFGAALSLLLFPEGKPAENSVLDEVTAMTIVAAVFAAPVCEELTIRKFVLDACVKRGLPPALYIVLTAVIFALIHDPTSMRYMVQTFSLGLVFAFCYYKTGVALYIIVAHASFNAFAVWITYISSEDAAETVEVVGEASGSGEYVVLLAVTGVFLALCVCAFVKWGGQKRLTVSDFDG
jgi:membrane protease YdiL (CAAX protease family)